MRLVDGRAFELTYKGYTASIPVEDPTIFDGWIDRETQEAPATYDENSAFENFWTDENSKVNPKDPYLDENEVTISRIYGDVEVSDPSVRNGIIGQEMERIRIYLDGSDPVRNNVYDADRATEDGHFERDTPDVTRIWVDPEKGMKMTEGFQMKTGDGRAVVEFKDGTKFILREHSQIRLEHEAIYLDNGKFIFRFVKKGKKIMIQNKRMKCNIIGTTFEIDTDDNGSTLTVYEGSVVSGSILSHELATVNAGEAQNFTNTGLGAKTRITENIDFDKIDNEIKIFEYDKAKQHGMFLFWGLVLGSAIAVTAVVLIIRKVIRKKKK
jgi:hypothetical protein